jgi:hypothetical protein
LLAHLLVISMAPKHIGVAVEHPGVPVTLRASAIMTVCERRANIDLEMTPSLGVESISAAPHMERRC